MRSIPRKFCGIYKITNLINGKVYIGQSRDIMARWAQHRFSRPKDHNTYLYNAIRKYGLENFVFEVLEECPVASLNERERHYIALHNSLKPNGYNIEAGGESKQEISAETRRRMSAAWKSRPPITAQERQNRALAHYKPVIQYSRSGEYLRTFRSIKAAAKAINVSPGNITACCKGSAPTAGGYQWRHWTGNTENIEPVRDGRKTTMRHAIPVSCFSLKGECVATYRSMKEAAVTVGVSPCCITACCKGEQKTAGGYVWRRADDHY